MVFHGGLDDLVSAYERDGFVNAGRVIDAAEIAALIADVEPYAERLTQGEQVPGYFPGYAGNVSSNPEESHFQISGLWTVSAAYRRLVENERILEIAARLGRAKTLQLWCDIFQYKPPHQGSAFHWHQDAPYHRIAFEPPELAVTAWVALDDAIEETGCMWMVPGSHRWGLQERHLWNYQHLSEPESFGDVGPPTNVSPDASPWRAAVPCRVRAGEVHFHHALTWHGSPSNRTNRPRRACTINYLPDGMRATGPDPRLHVPAGTPMIDAGPEFPVIYRAR